MYLELAEGETLSGHKRKRPVSYLPHPHQRGVMCREDMFDGMHEDDLTSHLNENAPELSEFDYQQLSARRKERKEAKFEQKQAKKAAKTDKKQAKADLKRAKGEAKIIKAQAKVTKAESGQKTTFQDVIGGITDVAGAATGVIGAVKGTKGEDAGAEAATETQPSFMQKYKMPLLIGGGLLLVGVAYMALKPKKS
jgi:hypothetical protein